MVACARAELADPHEVEVFHVYNRTVRRAHLCGTDEPSGKNYDYRRDWITARERSLARLFAIDVAFHAEMANHLHLILRTRPDIVASWSDEDVIRRWLTITKLTRSFVDVLEPPSAARIEEKIADADYVAAVRLRLSNISCFMAALCEYVARRANAEDEVSGRFWESRFKCRKCVDEAAILVCGIYVDLNQIRAGEASTPETSPHTSAHDRIETIEQQKAGDTPVAPEQDAACPDSWLCPLPLDERAAAAVEVGAASSTPWRASDKGILPLSTEQYLDLLDWTGRQLRADKPSGVIPSNLAPILERLGIRPTRWLDLINSLEHGFRRALGRLENLLQTAVAAGHRWLQGVGLASELFS